MESEARERHLRAHASKAESRQCNDYTLPTLEQLANGFNNLALFNQAMTHRSCAGMASNECLEYLGDAVLQLTVTERVMMVHRAHKPAVIYRHMSEGELAQTVTRYVRGLHLVEVAQRLHLGAYLHLGRSEEMSGGRDKPKILEDAMEALIGAIYIDRGMEAARRFVYQHIM